MGSSKGFLGESVIPFVVMICLTRRARPVCLVHECTRTFQWEIFKVLFPGWSVHHVTTNPPDYGVPVQRTRSYTVIVREDYEMSRPITDIFRLFIGTSLDAGVFCNATDGELQALKHSMAATVS